MNTYFSEISLAKDVVRPKAMRSGKVDMRRRMPPPPRRGRQNGPVSIDKFDEDEDESSDCSIQMSTLSEGIYVRNKKTIQADEPIGLRSGLSLSS